MSERGPNGSRGCALAHRRSVCVCERACVCVREARSHSFCSVLSREHAARTANALCSLHESASQVTAAHRSPPCQTNQGLRRPPSWTCLRTCCAPTSCQRKVCCTRSRTSGGGHGASHARAPSARHSMRTRAAPLRAPACCSWLHCSAACPRPACSLAQTCTALRALCDDALLWKDVVQRRFGPFHGGRAGLCLCSVH